MFGKTNASHVNLGSPEIGAVSKTRWEKRFDEFKGQLNTPAEKNAVESIGFEDIEKNIKDLIAKNSLTGKDDKTAKWLVLLGEAFNKTVTILEKYGAALDVLSQTNDILCPIWGAMRIFLTAVESKRQHVEKIYEWANLIAEQLPILARTEELYPTDKDIIEELDRIYGHLLTFYMHVISWYRDEGKTGKPQKIAANLSKAIKRGGKYGLSESASKELDSLLIDFKRARENLRDKVMLMEIEESRASRRDVGKLLEERDEGIRQKIIRYENNNKINMLNRLSNYAAQGEHRKLQSKRLRFTNEWLVADETFLTWLKADNSAFFILDGPAGSGKSVMMTKVIDHIRELRRSDEQSPSPNLGVAHYYCDLKNTEDPLSFGTYPNQIESPANILGALLRQLIEQLSLYEMMKEKLSDWFTRETEEVNVQTLCDAFVTLTEGKEVFLVIDALDELKKSRCESFIKCLNYLRAKKAIGLKIFVSTRFVHDVTFEPRNEIYKQVMSSENIARDLELIVAHKVREAASSTGLSTAPYGTLKADEEMVNRIIKRLTEKANGMVLLVEFHIIELCKAETENDMMKALEKLPESLYDAIAVMLDRICEDSTNKHHVRNILAWVLESKRPLHIDEVVEAISIDPTIRPKDLIRGNFIKPAHRVLSLCCGLLRADPSPNPKFNKTETLHVTHSTVLQFIQDREPLMIKAELYFEDPSKSSTLLAESCICYLDFTPYKQETQAKAPKSKAKAEQIENVGKIPDIIDLKGHAGTGIGRTMHAALKFTSTLQSSVQGEARKKKKAVAVGTQQKRDVSLALEKAGVEGAAGKSLVGNGLVLAKDSLDESVFGRHALQEYASSFWIHHARNLSREKTRLWSTIHVLVFDPNYLVGFIKHRPWEAAPRNEQWKPARVKPPPLYYRIFRWAIEHGNAAILRLLIEKGALEKLTDNLPMAYYHHPLLYLADQRDASEAVLVMATTVGAMIKNPTRKDSDQLREYLGKCLLLMLDQPSESSEWQPATKLKVTKALIEAGASVDYCDGTNVRIRKKLATKASEDYGSVPDEEDFSLIYIEDGCSAQLDAKQRVSGNTPLHIAAKHGLYDVAKYLLDKDAALTIRNSKGHYPYDLLSTYRSQYDYDSFGRWLYSDVAEDRKIGRAKTFELLADSLSRMEVPPGQKSPLHVAVHDSTTRALATLLKQVNPALVNHQDENGETPLMTLVKHRGYDVAANGDAVLDRMKLLLQNNADVNVRTKSGEVLHAANFLRVNEMKLLVSNGCDLRTSSKDGTTALMALQEPYILGHFRSPYKLFFTREEYVERADFLLKLGVDIHARDWKGQDALMHALVRYSREPESVKVHEEMDFLIELLLARGADINGVDYRGTTPLMLLMKAGSAQNFKFFDSLLASGVQITHGDLMDALAFAVNPLPLFNSLFFEKATHFEELPATWRTVGDVFLKKILQHDKDLEKVDHEIGNTVLASAAESGDCNAIELLISGGLKTLVDSDGDLRANIEHRNRKNESPLSLALTNLHTDAALLLVSGGAKCDLISDDFSLFYALQTVSEEREGTSKEVYPELLKKCRAQTDMVEFAAKILSVLQRNRMTSTGWVTLAKLLPDDKMTELFKVMGPLDTDLINNYRSKIGHKQRPSILNGTDEYLNYLWRERPNSLDALGWTQLHKEVISARFLGYERASERFYGSYKLGSIPQDEVFRLFTARDVVNRTPLHYAARYGRSDVLQFFMDSVPDFSHCMLDLVDCCGYTPLHMLLQFSPAFVSRKASDIWRVKSMLFTSLPRLQDASPDEIANPLPRDSLAFTLVEADIRGRGDEIMDLLGARVVVASIENMRTAAYYGFPGEHWGLYDLKPLSTNRGEGIPVGPLGHLIHYACAAGGATYRAVNKLVWSEKFPVNWKFPNRDGKYPLDLLAEFAAPDEAVKVLKGLARSPTNPKITYFNELDQDYMVVHRYEPLRHAARRGAYELVEILLELGFWSGREAGATLEKTALHLAVLGRHVKVAVRLLREDGLEGLYPELRQAISNDEIALKPLVLRIQSMEREEEARKTPICLMFDETAEDADNYGNEYDEDEYNEGEYDENEYDEDEYDGEEYDEN